MNQKELLEYGVRAVFYDNTTFMGYLNSDDYVDIHYVGWNTKKTNSFRIEIWRDECGCIYNEIKRFLNIDEAILFVVKNQ